MAAEHPIHTTHRYGGANLDATVPVVRRISWGAVFAGVVMALVVQVLLAMLGTGIGLSTMDPASGATPDAQTFGLGAGLWWAVSMLVALFIGGWVAGHIAGLPAASDGRLHGLLVWGLTTLRMLYLLSSTVGGVIGGAFNLMGNAAQGAAGASQEVIGGIVEQAKEVAREAGVNVDANRPGEVLTEQQKAEAAQRARQTADTAASVGAQAGLWGFGALLLGAIAAALGGSAGRPKDVLLAAR